MDETTELWRRALGVQSLPKSLQQATKLFTHEPWGHLRLEPILKLVYFTDQQLYK
jgi:hypothetical protein